MARPKKRRIVGTPPLFSSFKPTGVLKRDLPTIPMTLDEYEAIRLTDYLGMAHEEAADEMEISRSTFTRLIEEARYKAAAFFIEGKELQIEGGNIHFRGNIVRCMDCSRLFPIAFDETMDVCPSCGSADLIDVAQRFGHGPCCDEFFGQRRRRRK